MIIFEKISPQNRTGERGRGTDTLIVGISDKDVASLVLANSVRTIEGSTLYAPVVVLLQSTTYRAHLHPFPCTKRLVSVTHPCVPRTRPTARRGSRQAARKQSQEAREPRGRDKQQENHEAEALAHCNMSQRRQEQEGK